MGIYEEFACIYAKGPWPEYSAAVAELLPATLERFGAQPETVLDLACGEGTFAVLMAKRAMQVTGVDISPEMLRLATEKARREKVTVEFLLGDMRSLDFEERFDLVTCWFDSLNYLLERKGLEETFAGAGRALKKGGLFIFDMNTIYGLAVGWQWFPFYIHIDTPELFSVACPSYDCVKKTANLKITGFVREGDGWRRIDEEHRERGYTLKETRQCLRKAGLQELAYWTNLEEMGQPCPESDRVVFVARK